ncbi:MAG: flavin reductase, partial [Acidobacteria bacterium]|jgi:flavin reductase (DIM6/NTAB) family NADH-FMN oxidoreductase RutF|nr:flavin reductase [Acidobacteriota bacterium]
MIAAIKPKDLVLPPVDIWFKRWFLLTAGTKQSFNTMTVAWGSVGGMWEMPFVQVVVRPTRHTFGFMNEFDTFTLCSFPAKFRKDLALLGSRSGRDGDKIALTRLTPVKSAAVAAPSFKEADLVIECRKIYWQDLDDRHFLSEKIAAQYPQMDFHRVFFGEILRVRGSREFRRK